MALASHNTAALLSVPGASCHGLEVVNSSLRQMRLLVAANWSAGLQAYASNGEVILQL
jgi:hypothetical protein